jgi:UDP-N-acetylglucosamine 2-epimerase
VNPYGDGKASERIVRIIRHFFSNTDELPEEFIA